MGKYNAYNIADITSRDDVDPVLNPGEVIDWYSGATDGHKTFMYVKFDNGAGNVASANGALAYWKDLDAKTVTSDLTDAIGAADGWRRNMVAGVFLGVVTDARYAFIQTGGRHSTVLTNADDDILAGDWLIAATTDSDVDSVGAGTAPTYRVVGVALAADVDANDTVDALLLLDYRG